MFYEVAPGVVVETGYRGANVSAILTDEGTICVDTPMVPSQAVQWRYKIEELAGGKLCRYILITDMHRGHILGSQFFDCPVIGHDLAWKDMKGYSENYKHRVRQYFKREPAIQAEFTDIQIIVPEITFADKIMVVKGGRKVEMIYTGGHTAATSIIYMPEEKVIFTGDNVLCNEHPYMSQANTRQWLAALAMIKRMDVKVLVPGHGLPTTLEAVDETCRYIEFVRAEVYKLVKAGKDRKEVANILAPTLLAMYPVPPERRSRITQQIKQGVRKVFNETRYELNSPVRVQEDEEDLG